MDDEDDRGPPKLSNVQLATLMSECAAEGIEERMAFARCSKAGMVGIKRDQFAPEYEKLVAAPLLRKLGVRAAREAEFLQELTAACMQADPTEEEAKELAEMVSRARQNPQMVKPCLEMFTDYLHPSVIADLEVKYYALWPKPGDSAE